MMLETVRTKKLADLATEETLLKRAWITHIFYTVINVSNYFAGASTWLNGECSDEES